MLPEAWSNELHVEIRAESVIVDENSISGSGASELMVGDNELLVEQFRLATELGRLECGPGVLRLNQTEEIKFDRGIWEEGRFELFNADWNDLQLGISTRAEVLRYRPDGRIEAESLRLGCLCEGVSPWLIRGERVYWSPDRELSIEGGRFGLMGHAFMPIPKMSLPLQRRSGFLLPELGYGVDGVRLRSPLFLAMGRAADVTLTPEVRTERIIRVIAESRVAMHDGEFRGLLDGGRDWRLRKTRGVGQWSVDWYKKRLNFASEGQLIGDEDYLGDFGDRFLTRQTPWTESRTLLGWRQLELASRLVQNSTSTQQEIGSLAARLPARESYLGALIDAQSEFAFVGQGAVPWEVEVPVFSGQGRASMERPTVLGPLLLNPRLSVASMGRNDRFDVSGFSEFDLRLLGWSERKGYFRFEPGIKVRTSRGTNQDETSVGPQLILRRTSSSGLLWEGQGALSLASQELSADGWAAIRSDQGSWWVLGRGGPSVPREFASALNVQERSSKLEMRWMQTQTELGVVDFHQAGGSLSLGLPGRLSPLLIGGGLVVDWLHEGLVSRHATVRYAHPSGCLSLGLSGWFDEDRGFPDLALEVSLLPGRGQFIPLPQQQQLFP